MTRKHLGLVGAGGMLFMLALAWAGIATALPAQPRAAGSVEYGGVWVPSDGAVSFSFVASGSPSAATGRVQYQRRATGFEATSAGSVTCYLQVGNRGYLSGTLDRPFLSGPTEIGFFTATVVDGDATGGVDKAIVFLGADHVIPCDDPGNMAFLNSEVENTTVTRAQVQLIGAS
jgi:hypothetical protein